MRGPGWISTASCPVILLLLSTGLVAGSAHGQSSVVDTTPVWSSGPANSTRATALGDVNNDGILDLVCGNLTHANTLYLGNGDTFDTAPVWSPGAVTQTLGVALGDIDGDGDLDLVCGNLGANVLYLNSGGTLETTVAWTSDDAVTTTAVALGDVDGDGDLDLVCGNTGANVMYRNSGGVLETTPTWSSQGTNATRGIALGDVDNDGTLDLVCANSTQPNTMYAGSGGAFTVTASWSSLASNATQDVALGDIDGDGDLDLVCANTDQPDVVYRNLSGTLETVPTWSSTPTDSSLAASLGDIDGDGDIDLVCANDAQSNTIYENIGGVFAVVPSWSSSTTNTTADILLGDVDGDGDLDIVGGNSFRPNTTFRNNTPPLAAAPMWTASTTQLTLSVALGDVTGDGLPDLACGNNGANSLYINSGGSLDSVSTWTSLVTSTTTGVALGDIDGDGRNDLFCGNGVTAGQPNTLYTNTSGTFSMAPSWLSADATVTLGVALGDLDNDGDLDAVCASAGAPSVAYYNVGGALETTPGWATATVTASTDVAIGDVDGDGRVDLVFSNSLQPNTVYLNSAGGLATTPAWSSAEARQSADIAIGDIDGDGLADAVFVNFDEAITLYHNTAAPDIFPAAPSWSSLQNLRASSAKLADIDGDGFLDLAVGTAEDLIAQPNLLYHNTGGTFGAASVWGTATGAETEDVAAADIDRDGDLDIVYGNEQEPNTAYTGLRNPVFRGDPATPTNHTPNNAASVATLETTSGNVNEVPIRFRIVDIESDPVMLHVSYQFSGQPVWRPIDVLGAGGAMGIFGPFASSSAGVIDSLTWDISRFPFDSRDVILRVRAVESPRRASMIQRIPLAQRAVGRVVPIRPEIASTPPALDFPTVTIGDTTTVQLQIRNLGNVDLQAGPLVLPSNELRANPAGAFSVAPGATHVVDVHLEPLAGDNVTGAITVPSNDPTNPTHTVMITTDVRTLDVTVRLLTSDVEIPLGQAVTVIVESPPEVNVEGGTLFHRSVAEATFHSIPLGKNGDDFIAVVPGPDVAEGGLFYYVQVDNLPASAVQPPGAPAGGVFAQAVGAPTGFTTVPRETDGDDYAEGRAIRVAVDMPDGAQFLSGTLHYREGGATGYTQAPIIVDTGEPVATIAAPAVGARGVEYWAEVNSLTAALTDPATDPENSPRAIRVLVRDIKEPRQHAGKTYRLFSLPLAMQGSILGSIADELGGQNPARWRLFAWEPERDRYLELPNDTITAFTQGHAYWLVSRDPHRIGSGPDAGHTATTRTPFVVTLAPGYNLVSTPFNFAVPWDSVIADTLTMVDALGVLVESPIGWNESAGLYDSVTVMDPFDGYWIKNITPQPVVLKIPAVAASASVATRVATRDQGWRIGIRGTSVGATDAALAGVAVDAREQYDRNDHSKPPMAPGPVLSVYFPHRAWEKHGDLYARDMRSAPDMTRDDWGVVWRFDVAKTFLEDDSGDIVTLSFTGMKDTPPESVVRLVDGGLHRTVDLRTNDRYRFAMARAHAVTDDEKARFALIVGSESFADGFSSAPALTRLHQNTPNPFNPATRIRYDIAVTIDVTIDIYDVTGARVRGLEKTRRTPGSYDVVWDGANDTGARVSTGIYFYRMRAGDFIATRKMLLLK